MPYLILSIVCFCLIIVSAVAFMIAGKNFLVAAIMISSIISVVGCYGIIRFTVHSDSNLYIEGDEDDIAANEQ